MESPCDAEHPRPEEDTENAPPPNQEHRYRKNNQEPDVDRKTIHTGHTETETESDVRMECELRLKTR